MIALLYCISIVTGCCPVLLLCHIYLQTKFRLSSFVCNTCILWILFTRVLQSVEQSYSPPCLQDNHVSFACSLFECGEAFVLYSASERSE